MILLDDAQSTAALPTSRQYENALHYWWVLLSGDHAVDLAATQQCFTEISAALAKGEFIVAAFAYELGRQIHHLPERVNHSDHHHPLIEAWSFAEFKKLSKQDVDSFIAQRLASLDLAQASAAVMDVQQSLS